MTSGPQNNAPGDTGSLQTGAKRNSPEAHHGVTQGASASCEELHQSCEERDNDNDDRGAGKDPTSVSRSLPSIKIPSFFECLPSIKMPSFFESPSSSESDNVPSPQMKDQTELYIPYCVQLDVSMCFPFMKIPKMVVKEKFKVGDESLFLLKTQKWRELCTVIEDECQVHMRRNQWTDTWILGSAENVKKAMAKVEKFVDENTVRKEEFKCDKSMRGFLVEQRKDEIKSIQQKLEQFQVKIEKCDREEDLVIAGTKKGLARAHKMLALLTTKLNVFKESFQIQQSGLRKFLTKGRGDQLVRSVERDQECVVDVKHNFKKETEESAAAVESCNDEDQESGDDDVDSDDYVTIYGTTAGNVAVARPLTLIVDNCKISWKTGDITKEQVRYFIVLVRVTPSYVVLCFVFSIFVSCHP